jgi:methionyl aminopeptidase
VITRKSAAEIERMRRAGRIVAEVLALMESELKPGVTTGHLDSLAERHIRGAGAIPSFMGYLGSGRYGRGPKAFPASTCISIDSEVVHGIPGDRAIKAGSIVSVDVGAILDGWHGDGARTFVVGEASPEITELVATTRLAMMAGIAAAVPGANLGDVAAAIEDAALPGGYGIVRQFVGHGIGTEMHEEPQLPNYRTGVRGMKLVPGICLAIEPMLTLGSHEVSILPDGWTVVTRDGSLAAHFEHTIAVTENGPEILTTVA